MRSILALLLALSLTASAAPLSRASASALDQATLSLNERNYRLAVQQLIPIYRELLRQSPGFPKRTQVDSLLRNDHSGVISLLEQSRTNLNSGDTNAAKLSLMALSLSLISLDGKQDPAQILARERAAFTAPKGSGLWLGQAQAVMIASWKAGAHPEATELATDLLNAAPHHPESALYIHTAHTILGLSALEQQNITAAQQHLLASISSLKPDLALQGGQPIFALAEALLAKGHKDTVLTFLDATIQFDGWHHVKPRLTTYRNQLAAGQLTTFGQDNFLH